MDEKEKEAIEKAKNEALEAVTKKAEEVAEAKATATVTEAVKSLTEKTEEAVKKFEASLENVTSKEEVEKQKTEIMQEISKLQAKLKEMKQTTPVKSSNVTAEKALLNAVRESAVETFEKQKSFAGGSTLTLTEKALSPADFGSAADYNDLNSDRRLPLDRNPYAPVYLRNIFPNISTSNGNLVIWKREAITGAAAIWRRGTGEEGADVPKPEVKPTFKKEAVSIDWIAGRADIPKEMRDDIDFISTEVPYTLVYSEKGILAAENKMILDYLLANGVDFTRDADYPIGLEKVIAAAFGQLGSAYMTATHILINNWDYLTYFAFNKAAGSGEYDLPGLKLSFINGQMYINNLIAIPVPELASRQAIVVATGRSRFVDRRSIELKISEEHADNFTKNMLTYRAEERAGFFTYDDNSIVKVTLPELPEPEEPVVP